MFNIRDGSPTLFTNMSEVRYIGTSCVHHSVCIREIPLGPSGYTIDTTAATLHRGKTVQHDLGSTEAETSLV